MNREKRREYDRKVKKDKRADICPKCKHLALFYSTGELKEEAYLKQNPQKEDFNTKICCGRCGATIYEGEDVSKLIPPGIYIPIKLDLLDYALKHRERIEEINNDNNIYVIPNKEESGDESSNSKDI